jgi:uncharacterized membrane protein
MTMLAYTQGIYDTLKWLHVMGAITWIGSGLFVQYYATRLRRENEWQRLGAFARDLEKASRQLFIPASAVVLVLGISMVAYAPFVGIKQTWVWLGLVGYAATFVTGAFFIGPTAVKLGKTVDAEGPDTPAIRPLVTRIFTISRIDQVVLLLVVADMVFKPGR